MTYEQLKKKWQKEDYLIGPARGVNPSKDNFIMELSIDFCIYQFGFSDINEAIACVRFAILEKELTEYHLCKTDKNNNVILSDVPKNVLDFYNFLEKLLKSETFKDTDILKMIKLYKKGIQSSEIRFFCSQLDYLKSHKKIIIDLIYDYEHDDDRKKYAPMMKGLLSEINKNRFDKTKHKAALKDFFEMIGSS